MGFFKKWYIYQKERFPILKYGVYIFAIVFSTYCFINWLAISSVPNLIEVNKLFKIEWKMILIMFAVTFLQFLMVRIIDEFKDYEEDCKYRPYRPVPRGLITLKELKLLFIICAFLQLLLTLLFCVKAIPFLIIVWIFFAMMSKGFFIKKITEKHILLEVALDEVLMPILILYLSMFPFGSINQLMTSKFFYIFLFMTYIISWIVEFARKVRCKEDEEKGVKTYTAVFGIKKAVLFLSVLEVLLCITQGLILGKNRVTSVICLFAAVILINFGFIIRQNKRFAKFTELSANIYIFLVYFSMGLLLV